MVSFEVEGGEAGAFRFLDALSLVKLAVSLGSTESLAEHPATMTHAGVDPDEKRGPASPTGWCACRSGVEHPDDLIADLTQCPRWPV
jgi:methionine-gamma-lyase